MWFQKHPIEGHSEIRCSGCGRKISDIAFNAPSGGAYCQKCAIEMPVRSSSALPVPPVKGETGKPGRTASAMAPAEMLPPALPWGLVWLLTVITAGIFGTIWILVEADYAHRLRTSSKPLLFYGIGFPALFVAAVMSVVPELRVLAALFQIAGGVLIIAGHFSLKNALEEYYTSVEPLNLKLSGRMTFFFSVVYFQYHLSRIRDWKMTGVRNPGAPSFQDVQPRKGIIYTQSEIEAMRNRAPSGVISPL